MEDTSFEKEDFDEILARELAKFSEQHKAKVTCAHGNTYISFGVSDYITENFMYSITKLLDLMQANYAFVYAENPMLSINGENQQMKNFIQKFINDGYILKYE